MPNDEKPILYHREKEDVMEVDTDDMEPIARFIAFALAGLATSPTSDGANANMSAIFTAEDRKAFASLGTPEELVGRILSQIEAAPPESPTDVETYRDLTSMCTLQDRPAVSSEAGREFNELKTHHRDFQRQQKVNWTCEYQKIKKLGRGGQGVVHLIEDEFGEQLALKMYSPEPYGDARAYFDDTERMKSLAHMVPKRHDNLLDVEHFFKSPDGIAGLVMKVIDGFDLCRILQKDIMTSLQKLVSSDRWAFLHKNVFAQFDDDQWGLKPGVAVNICEKVLRGLGAMHEASIVHRDVKPSNVMLDVFGSIRLIDIGSAVHLAFPSGQPSWTPRYAPPEVLDGGECTQRSDLASVGYMLIELISGRPCVMEPPAGWDSVRMFDKKKRLALAEEKRQLPNRLHEIIPIKAQSCSILMELIRKLIHPDPNKRFIDADKAIEQTDSFRDSLVRGGYSMTWVQVIKFLVRDVKEAVREKL